MDIVAQLTQEARDGLTCPRWCVAPDDDHIFEDPLGGVFVQHRGPAGAVRVIDADDPGHQERLHLKLVQNAAAGGTNDFIGFPTVELGGHASLRLRAEAAFELGEQLILLSQRLEDELEPYQRAAVSFLQRLDRVRLADGLSAVSSPPPALVPAASLRVVDGVKGANASRSDGPSRATLEAGDREHDTSAQAGQADPICRRLTARLV